MDRTGQGLWLHALRAAEIQPARLEHTGPVKPAHRLAQCTWHWQAGVCSLTSLGSWLWRRRYLHSCSEPSVFISSNTPVPDRLLLCSRPCEKGGAADHERRHQDQFSLVLSTKGSHSGSLPTSRDSATATPGCKDAWGGNNQ